MISLEERRSMYPSLVYLQHSPEELQHNDQWLEINSAGRWWRSLVATNRMSNLDTWVYQFEKDSEKIHFKLRWEDE